MGLLFSHMTNHIGSVQKRFCIRLTGPCRSVTWTFRNVYLAIFINIDNEKHPVATINRPSCIRWSQNVIGFIIWSTLKYRVIGLLWFREKLQRLIWITSERTVYRSRLCPFDFYRFHNSSLRGRAPFKHTLVEIANEQNNTLTTI